MNKLRWISKSNWQLILLGSTAFVLSVASGWTTWTGISNFTGNLFLSFLITFGIQGLMLITAWLIGETFERALGGSRNHILKQYVIGCKAVLQNLPLWCMFLACMATSVFFSFDALFDSIFSSEERARVSLLRSRQAVERVVADVNKVLDRRIAGARSELFKSREWKRYEGSMDRLIGGGEEVRNKIQNANKLHEKEQRRLAGKRDELAKRLKVVSPRVVKLDEKVRKLRNQLEQKNDEIERVHIASKAEERGVGKTGMEGRGPRYRVLEKKVYRLGIERELILDQLKIADAALKEASKEKRIKEELIQEIGSEMATDGQGSFAVGFGRLKESQDVFQGNPSRKEFEELQRECGAVSQAVQKFGKRIVEACGSSDLQELAGRLFGRQEGKKRYEQACREALEEEDTEMLIKASRKCLSLAGLSKNQVQNYQSVLKALELNRDDKAHRFVVTWNAVVDGNRLAVLALSIGVIIDGMVFMTGLIGAHTLRGPLSRSPGAREYSTRELEQIIDGALGPDKKEAATTALRAMRTITNVDGYIAEVILAEHELEDVEVFRNVLTSGSAIGLVQQDEKDRERYLVRSELFHYLCQVRGREQSRALVVVDQPMQAPVVTRDVVRELPVPMEGVQRRFLDQKERRANEAVVIFRELYVDLDDKINGKGFEDAVGVLRRWYGETIRKLEGIKNSQQASDMDRLTVNALKEHISKLAAADDDNQDEWTDFGRRLLGLSDRMRVREMDLVEAS